ncbi:MAG TPA: biotin transporter BioY [Armatimonadota bacterium]|jgi:biotin transport system substrate-specific component
MTASTLLLPNVELRPSTRARDAALIISASLFLALAAQARFGLPFSPVPITGQTLAVALIGILLGSRRGAAAVALYLAQGALGAPVFAGLTGGPLAFIGPTGGYLVAMPFAAWLAGSLAEIGWDRTPLGAFATAMLASICVLIPGAAWLSLLLHGAARAATVGLLPFVPGELGKAVLICAALPTVWRVKRLMGGR